MIVAAMLGLASAGWSAAANALLVHGGFTGTIFSGFDLGSDPSGYFGLGSDLDNQPITGTFRYDTTNVPPPTSVGPNSATYNDPAFATDFLEFSVTINGRTYAFGNLASPPGIQSIDVIDNTDQLQFDYSRFGPAGAQESISLRFISVVDFLAGTGVPARFDFIASGVGLTPGGTFEFDLPNGDFAFASFTIDTGFASVPEPGTLGVLASGLLGLALMRRRGANVAARPR